MKEIIIKSLSDITSGSVIAYIIKVGLMAGVLSLATAWAFSGMISSFVSSYLSWITWSWLQNLGSGFASTFAIYILFTVYSMIITSMSSEKLLVKIAKRHYKESVEFGTPIMLKSILVSLKALLVFVVLFVPVLVVLFIPILGQIVMLWLWSVLLNKPASYEIHTIFKLDKNIKHTTKLSMVAALFNYVPILNLFSPIFAQIMFMHSGLLERKNIQSSKN